MIVRLKLTGGKIVKYRPDDVILYSNKRYVISVVNRKFRCYSVRCIEDDYFTWFPSEIDECSKYVCDRSDLPLAERRLSYDYIRNYQQRNQVASAEMQNMRKLNRMAHRGYKY